MKDVRKMIQDSLKDQTHDTPAQVYHEIEIIQDKAKELGLDVKILNDNEMPKLMDRLNDLLLNSIEAHYCLKHDLTDKYWCDRLLFLDDDENDWDEYTEWFEINECLMLGVRHIAQEMLEEYMSMIANLIAIRMEEKKVDLDTKPYNPSSRMHDDDDIPF